MLYIFCKVILTAVIIVLISELVKINDKIGALIAAMPITTFFVLFWLYFDNVSMIKISNHMTYTLFYLLPTIPMFILFPLILNKFDFRITVLFCMLVTSILVYITDFILKKVERSF